MPDPTELQALFLLSDEPIDSHEDDFLNRSDEARAIAGTVLGTMGPFTVGIFGQWGSGKTSLMHHVKSLLEARDAKNDRHLAYPYLVTVVFNAWQHERDDEPLAHLAEAVDAAITKRLAEVEALTERVLNKSVAALRSFHLSVRSIVYATSVESRFDPTDKPGENRGWQFWKWVPFLKLSPKDAIERYHKLQKESDKPESHAWKDHLERSVSRAVLKSFAVDKELLKATRRDPTWTVPRVVVFIDDMDRCLPEDAFKLLQAIKLVLAQPGFIFVMTLDPAALQKVIAAKTAEAGVNGEKASKAIYLDKLVQLPFPLRLRDEQFTDFVDKIIDVRLMDLLVAPASQQAALTDKSIAPLWQAFRDLRTVLAVSSEKNPRTLVRRINSLLMDARLAPQSIKDRLIDDPVVAEAIKEGRVVETMTNTEIQDRARVARRKAEGVFIGLCLIRDTLRQFVGVVEADQLSTAEDLCRLIKDRGLNACVARSIGASSERKADELAAPSPASAELFSEGDVAELTRRLELLRALKSWPRLDELFKTDAGQHWLSSKDERDLVDTFYAKRPEQPAAVPQAAAPARADAPVEVRPQPATATDATLGPEPASGLAGAAPEAPAISGAELALLERAIRGALDLPAGTPLTMEHMAGLKGLGLIGDPITDAGAAWLSRPDSGLKALTVLSLNGTKVGDAGAASLSRPDSGLKALTTLWLTGTKVGDAGAASLSRPDAGLKALTGLSLDGTQVGDAGASSLSRPDSGLKALTWLRLDGTQVGDAGAASLSRPDSGLKALTELYLTGTEVGDAGAAWLSRPESGLKALTGLWLSGTEVGDAGAAWLSRPDSGLKALTTLSLHGTQVGDAGAASLSRPDSGLKALTTLYLGGTQVGDAGAASLSRPDSGLKALTTLGLDGTKVSKKAAQAIGKAHPKVTVHI
ncbi:MAG: P-loop NTPase fold protein [Phycisphaerales bacterium]